MATILKSGVHHSQIRPLGAPLESAAPITVADPFAPFEQRIATLEAELSERDARLEQLRADVTVAREKGLAEGRELGRREAEDRQTQRNATLAKAIAAAEIAFSDALAETERLALIVAGDCLDKLFADRSRASEWVGALLRTQLARLDRTSVVAVTVSGEDFSAADLETLRETAIVEGTILERDPTMASGGCVLRARLGEIDIGLDTQWGAVRALLGAAADAAQAAS